MPCALGFKPKRRHIESPSRGHGPAMGLSAKQGGLQPGESDMIISHMIISIKHFRGLKMHVSLIADNQGQHSYYSHLIIISSDKQRLLI
jgi:hypothetical protein